MSGPEAPPGLDLGFENSYPSVTHSNLQKKLACNAHRQRAAGRSRGGYYGVRSRGGAPGRSRGGAAGGGAHARAEEAGPAPPREEQGRHARGRS
jgi:hypothetical protein